jgi:hypothetical protein
VTDNLLCGTEFNIKFVTSKRAEIWNYSFHIFGTRVKKEMMILWHFKMTSFKVK